MKFQKGIICQTFQLYIYSDESTTDTWLIHLFMPLFRTIQILMTIIKQHIKTQLPYGNRSNWFSHFPSSARLKIFYFNSHPNVQISDFLFCPSWWWQLLQPQQNEGEVVEIIADVYTLANLEISRMHFCMTFSRSIQSFLGLVGSKERTMRSTSMNLPLLDLHLE